MNRIESAGPAPVTPFPVRNPQPVILAALQARAGRPEKWHHQFLRASFAGDVFAPEVAGEAPLIVEQRYRCSPWVDNPQDAEKLTRVRDSLGLAGARIVCLRRKSEGRIMAALFLRADTPNLAEWTRHQGEVSVDAWAARWLPQDAPKVQTLTQDVSTPCGELYSQHSGVLESLEAAALEGDREGDIVSYIRCRRAALTADDLAELLSMSRKHLYKLAKDGRIPSYRIGGAVRFDPRATADWLENRTIN